MKDKKIKLLAFMEADTVTGPAKSLLEFARAARPEEGDLPGVDVRVATFQRPGAKEDFITTAKNAGVAISVIPEKRALDFSVLAKLRAVVQEWSPDILQTTGIKSHFLVKLLGLPRRYPWIASHHGYTTTDTKMRIYNQLDRYSLRSARHVFVVCQAFSREIIRAGVRPERISVHHNMVLPFQRPGDTAIEALRVKLGMRSGEVVILSVGRLSREKAHQDLIRAVAEIRRVSPALDFRLVLVGEGPEQESLHRLSIKLGVEDRVIFAGYHADVSAFYAMADVFALPSHSEGSPNVLLEALAAGVPSVATSVGGVPEIAVHEENALLVPKGDFSAMAKAILRLLSDAPLRAALADKGRRVTERYTIAAYRRRIVGVYKKILKI